jgi:hypothetical protein
VAALREAAGDFYKAGGMDKPTMRQLDLLPHSSRGAERP